MAFFVFKNSDGSRVLGYNGKAAASFDAILGARRYRLPSAGLPGGFVREMTGQVQGTEFSIDVLESDLQNASQPWLQQLGPAAEVYLDAAVFGHALDWRTKNKDAPVRTTDTWVDDDGGLMHLGVRVSNFSCRIIGEKSKNGPFELEATYNGTKKTLWVSLDELRGQTKQPWEWAVNPSANIENRILMHHGLSSQWEADNQAK
jgi:hypothetical protein